MKFGKRLSSTLVQGWQSHYVDYGAIKALIKQLTAPGSGHDPASQIQGFSQLLNHQLATVNAFFQCEEAGIIAKWRSIDLTGLRSLSSSQVQAAREWLGVRIGTHGRPVPHSTAMHASQLGAAGLQLQLFCDVYDVAQQLRQYTAINFVAFIKGMKKFEKQTKRTISTAFMPRLQRSKFFVSTNLAVLLTEMDNAARDLLETVGLCRSGVDTKETCCHNPECQAKIDRVAVVLSCAHRLCWQCTALSCS
eukprot:21168_5